MRDLLPLRLASRLEGRVQRPAWALGCAAVAVLLLALYALGRALGGVRAGDGLGLAFGLLALLLLAGLTLLSARRRTMAWGLGRAQNWVQFHVYGGGLFLLLVLLHGDFRWPRAALTGWLLALSVWLTLSGLAGVLLRKWIPRVLTSGLSHEILFERIPELVAELRGRAARLAEAASAPLAELHRRDLAPRLAAARRRWLFLFDITGGGGSERQLEFLRPLLPAADQERCRELAAILAAKRELDAHFTLQSLLRGWLALHVPVAFALLALVVAHLATALYF